MKAKVTFIVSTRMGKQMKLKHIFFAALMLMLSVPFAVDGQVILDGKTAQPKVIDVFCPKQLQVGPLSVPAGWQSLGSLPRPLLRITVDNQKQMILCVYGDKDSLFFTYFIGRKIAAGYDCEIPSPTVFQTVCKKKTRVRPGGR